MTVALTTDQEKFIAEQMKSGHYTSVDDVIAESLRMLQAQEEFIQAHTAELREKISLGVEQIRRGEVVDGRAAIAQLLEKNRNRPRAKA